MFLHIGNTMTNKNKELGYVEICENAILMQLACYFETVS